MLSVRHTAVRILVLVAILNLTSGCRSSAASESDAELKPVLGFVEALTSADIELLTSVFTEDATVFMPFDRFPKRLDGKAAIRAAFERPFAAMRAEGPPPYARIAPRDLAISRAGDVAIITFHLGELAPGRTETANLSRRTFVVRRDGSEWRIAHLHASNMAVPPPPAAQQ